MELSFLSNRQPTSTQKQGLHSMKLKLNPEADRGSFLPQSPPDILSFSSKDAALSPIRFSAETGLHVAAKTGNYDQVNNLIQLNKRHPTLLSDFLIAQDRRGKTALHLAAKVKDEKKAASIASLLLNPYGEHKQVRDTSSAKILLNATDLTNRTPLHDAVLSGQRELTHLLIIAGSNLNARDNGGHTALHLAGIEGYTDILSDLLENGARKDIEDAIGRTPLAAVKNSGLLRKNEIKLLS